MLTNFLYSCCNTKVAFAILCCWD